MSTANPRSMRAALLGAFVALAALAACSREPVEPRPPPTTVALGTYRAVLTVPGGELPFRLDLAREDGHAVAYLVNGAERVRIPDAKLTGTDVELAMPGYENRIEAEATPQGLSGHAVMLRPGGKIVRIPFKATAGREYRFHASPGGGVNVAGRWAVTFTAPNGTTEAAVAEFEQNGATVTGTFLTPTGDHRFLEGQVRGNELRLSRFDGGSAYLYAATLQGDGTLAGRHWSGTWSEQTWTARRDDTATLADAATAMRDARAPFAFTFPDLDGKPVSLTDDRFRGKVVIVSIGGSWCPNCHDEAEFLQPYYRELKARGLEIVYLQFEHFGDFAQAVQANRRFVQRFGIEWPVLIAGISDKDDVRAKLAQLDRFVAYPTSIFIDRKGQVRRIHTGFSGPATGKHYAEWKVEFEQLVNALLAERA